MKRFLPEDEILFIDKVIRDQKFNKYSSPRLRSLDVPVELSKLDFSFLLNSIKAAIDADFTVPPETSPIRPLIDTIVDTILLLIKAIQNGDKMKPPINDEAGLVPDPNFRPVTGKYFAVNTDNPCTTMPNKLMKLKSLDIRRVEESAILDLYSIIEWLISLTSGVTRSFSQFLVEKKCETEQARKRINHEIVLRNHRINKVITQERKARNRNAARWRKLRK